MSSEPIDLDEAHDEPAEAERHLIDTTRLSMQEARRRLAGREPRRLPAREGLG